MPSLFLFCSQYHPLLISPIHLVGISLSFPVKDFFVFSVQHHTRVFLNKTHPIHPQSFSLHPLINDIPKLMVETKEVKNPIHLIAAPFLYLAVLTSRFVSAYPFRYKTLPTLNRTVPTAHTIGYFKPPSKVIIVYESFPSRKFWCPRCTRLNSSAFLWYFGVAFYVCVYIIDVCGVCKYKLQMLIQIIVE